MSVRILCLVADGFGVGEAPDASKYGDRGCNTLAHVAEAVGGIRLPALQRLGLGNLGDFRGLAKTDSPLALTARLTERSEGKDTTTGHWEIAGAVTEVPLALFPNGFPDGLVEHFVREAAIPGVLGNKAASGTQIIEELGEESIRTGKPILYTSADSVFQIAAHETVFGLERLYKICEVARRITLPLNIGRVIARPFVGEKKGQFKRTERRKDYSIAPPPNCLDILQAHGVEVCSVGKIDDIFNCRGITLSRHTGNNADSLKASLDLLIKNRNHDAFIFANLIDFDMIYGHRRDPRGYAKALADLDAFLPQLLAELSPADCLVLTSDHGCDPTFRGTDHTREFVPMLAYCAGFPGKDLGVRDSFADISASLLNAFGIVQSNIQTSGVSFLPCKPKN
ncbi:MAG: phosphopentomutase [Deltaproteobacteria bacterium]|nr:phosphopentomutase [Deltaproteobacteria bacterium]